MTDLLVSLVLTGIVTVALRLWFGETGLSQFPVLTFLCIGVATFFLTEVVHSWLSPSGDVIGSLPLH